jgi:RNA polymerase sigma-70 factor (sigma-E family)
MVGPGPDFEEFVREHLHALGRYAYELTGRRHAGEDLVQDTLVKLARAWRRVEADGNPLGYARTVMFRTHVSRWRTLRRRPSTVGLDTVRPATDRPAGSDAFAGVDDRDALRRLLSVLPAAQRAVLVLGYLDGAGDEQIAEVLGKRPATVRSLRSRALATLRDRLGPEANPTALAEVSHGPR